MYDYRATVIKVLDADTIDVDVDLGISIHVMLRIRVEGINAPENSTLEGRYATAWAREMMPAGAKLLIHTKKDTGQGDKFGRWLASISLPVDGADYATLAIGFGHALPWNGQGKKPV